MYPSWIYLNKIKQHCRNMLIFLGYDFPTEPIESIGVNVGVSEVPSCLSYFVNFSLSNKHTFLSVIT